MLFLFFQLVDVYTFTEFTMRNYAYVDELYNWEQLRIMDFLSGICIFINVHLFHN